MPNSLRGEVKEGIRHVLDKQKLHQYSINTDELEEGIANIVFDILMISEKEQTEPYEVKTT